MSKTYSGTVERDGNDLMLVFPLEVMDAIDAKPGDEVVWRMKDGVVSISKRVEPTS